MVLAHLTEASSVAIASAAEGPVTVDLDASTLVQIGLFIVLFLVLKPVLFDPMLKLFEEREKRIDGAKLQARKIDEKSASALTKYETEMAKARASANEERDKLRAEGMKTENEILEKVRKATAETLDQGKRQAREEAARVRTTLQTETAQMAKDLAARVLGREVQG